MGKKHDSESLNTIKFGMVPQEYQLSLGRPVNEVHIFHMVVSFQREPPTMDTLLL